MDGDGVGDTVIIIRGQLGLRSGLKEFGHDGRKREIRETRM